MASSDVTIGLKNVMTIVLITLIWIAGKLLGFQAFDVIDLYLLLIMGMLVNISLSSVPLRVKNILGTGDDTSTENQNTIAIFAIVTLLMALYYMAKSQLGGLFPAIEPRLAFFLNGLVVVIVSVILGDARGFNH